MEKKELLENYNSYNKNTLMETLGIVYTDAGDGFLEGTMPITPRIHQPYGLMHGGASISLAESLGSMLSFLSIDQEEFVAVGTHMDANHLVAKRDGMVTGRAEIIRKGRMNHLVKIEIRDEEGKLICYCHLTNAIIPKGYV